MGQGYSRNNNIVIMILHFLLGGIKSDEISIYSFFFFFFFFTTNDIQPSKIIQHTTDKSNHHHSPFGQPNSQPSNSHSHFQHPTMSTLTFLLTILAIISTILSSTLEPRKWGHQIDMGVLTSDYIEGFIGDRPFTGPNGDYLRTTFCYCRSEMDVETNLTESPIEKRLTVSEGNRDGQHSGGGNGIQPGEILQGHFWRWEYFNFHYNTTYFMNHYCMEDAFPKDDHGCGSDMPGKFDPNPISHFNTDPGTGYTFTYSPLPGHNQHSWQIFKQPTDIDWMMFGRGDYGHMQKRRLDKEQGLIKMPKEYVDDKCNFYCDTELLLPMDYAMYSHGELYNDVDDMCDRCK